MAGATIQSGSGAAGAGPTQVSVGPPSGVLAQPVSDAQIRRELAASGLSANARQATLTSVGLAIAPIGAPASVQAVIQAGNEIAHLPYVWGGGHGRYVDTGYDCSGSLSFVLGAGGILNTTMTSGELANWGAPGPGQVDHDLRQQRSYVHVRRRSAVRHRRARADRHPLVQPGGQRAGPEHVRRPASAGALEGDERVTLWPPESGAPSGKTRHGHPSLRP